MLFYRTHLMLKTILKVALFVAQKKMHQVYDVEIGGRGIYKLLTGGNIK